MAISDDNVETVDGELMLALEPRPDGSPAELPAHLAAELEELIDAAQEYASRAQAENTSRSHASDWKQFETWAERYGFATLPAPVSVVTCYVTTLAKRGLTVSTIRQHAAAAGRAHRQADHLPPTSDPAFLTVLEGIARVHGAAPNTKTAMLRDPLLEIVDLVEPSAHVGLRDRALLLVGFALGLRRSELIAIRVEDLSPSPDGITVQIPKSKTDQRRQGHELLLVYGQSPATAAASTAADLSHLSWLAYLKTTLPTIVIFLGWSHASPEAVVGADRFRCLCHSRHARVSSDGLMVCHRQWPVNLAPPSTEQPEIVMFVMRLSRIRRRRLRVKKAFDVRQRAGRALRLRSRQAAWVVTPAQLGV